MSPQRWNGLFTRHFFELPFPSGFAYACISNYCPRMKRSMAMLYVYLVLLLVINAFWLALVFFYLPGNWLMVLTTAAFAWGLAEQGIFSVWTLLAAAVLALLGELAEFLAGFGGARRAGAGWKASLAAVGGALGGAFSAQS
jgi:uncharacterized protein YqgC (DUF456 family)